MAFPFLPFGVLLAFAVLGGAFAAFALALRLLDRAGLTARRSIASGIAAGLRGWSDSDDSAVDPRTGGRRRGRPRGPACRSAGARPPSLNGIGCRIAAPEPAASAPWRPSGGAPHRTFHDPPRPSRRAAPAHRAGVRRRAARGLRERDRLAVAALVVHLPEPRRVPFGRSRVAIPNAPGVGDPGTGLPDRGTGLPDGRRIGRAVTVRADRDARPAVPASAPPTASAPAVSPPAATIDWATCEQSADFECGTLTVPLDEVNPGAETIELALVRLPAGDQNARIGSLLVQPGRPGCLGGRLRPRQRGALFRGPASPLRPYRFRSKGRRIELAGRVLFGRGVRSGRRLDPTPDNPAERDALIDDARNFVAACVRQSGHLLPFMSTEQAARDMGSDPRRGWRRQVSPTLGFSYGTFLGSTYALAVPGSDPGLGPGRCRRCDAALRGGDADAGRGVPASA